MKKVSYEKVGVREQARYHGSQHRTDTDSEFRINGFGIRELMPPVIVDRPDGTGDWFFVLFHDAISVRLEDGLHHLKAGTLVMWPHGSSHWYGCEDEVWEHSWIHFDGSWAADRLAECGLMDETLLKLNNPVALENCLWRLYVELTDHRHPDLVIQKNIFHNWLRELMRDAEEDETLFIPERIRAAKKYLNQHMREHVSLQMLASHVGMSVPHLCAEFKRCYGGSPINYLIELRLRQARYLLLDRRLRIGEIAARVGYEDVYHFSRIFKKHFGLSPRAMRNRPGLNISQE